MATDTTAVCVVDEALGYGQVTATPLALFLGRALGFRERGPFLARRLHDLLPGLARQLDRAA